MISSIRVLFAACLVFSAAGPAFSQSRASVDPMSKGMLGRLQGFMEGKMGMELAVLDPSLAAIGNLDAENPFHREALGMLAVKLGDKDAFKTDVDDPAKAQELAVRIVQANRDPDNLAFISAKIAKRLAEMDDLRKKDRADAAAGLAPLIKYARPIRDLSGIVERARKTAEALELSKELGLDDKDVYVDESDSSLVWRPILSIGPMGQFGTGKIEVSFKEGKLGALSDKKLRAYQLKHPIPVFRSEKGRIHVFKHNEAPDGSDLPMDDHHHLLDTLFRLGIKEVPTKELESSGKASSGDMEKHVYLYDQWGVRHAIEELPRNVRGLGDFPYRGVSWLVRELGGFEKQPVPYLEMYVGDVLRRNTKTHPNVDLYQSVMESLRFSRTAKFKDWFQGFVESHR